MLGLFSSLQFRLALGFVVALAVALLLIGMATGVVAGKQTQRFERDRVPCRWHGFSSLCQTTIPGGGTRIMGACRKRWSGQVAFLAFK